MKLTPFLIGGIFLVSSCTAQKSGKFETNPNGLEYRYVTKGDGKVAPSIGDFGEISVVFKIGDSVLINTNEMNNNQPVPQQFQQGQMKGDLMEGLLMMRAGDSMIFRMNMDTLAARSGQPKPEWSKPGDYAIWEVKMHSVKTAAEMEKEMAEAQAGQRKADDETIQKHLNDKGIKQFKRTESGLYYVKTKENAAAAAPTKGQQVTVNYTGMNLNGEKFDSNVDPQFNHVEPFTFGLGQRQVIQGWDEALTLMKKGEKATFYIPSYLAYGERGAGDRIPPNSILIFEIELVDFK